MRKILLFLLATSGSVAAQDAMEGGDLYMRHCAQCHGAEAAGGGPMAAILTLQPTDLTQMSANNDGVFPLERVVKRIDGRDPLVAHGSPMPVFGDFFDGIQHVSMKTSAGQPVLMSETVADLVTFIKSVQE